MDAGGLVVAQDVGTALCGAFNAAYFAGYWRRPDWPRGRRIGALALVLVALAALAGAAFSEVLFWAGSGALPPVAWALARTPLFASTAFISAIVVRRIRGAR